MPILYPHRPRRKDRDRSLKSLVPNYDPSAPVALQVLVTSVVAQGGGAVITFGLPVTLNELGPGETIRFDDGTHSGFAEDLSQAGASEIFVNGVPGVILSAGAQWAILAVPECFILPPGAVLPVPQMGTVE